MSVREGPVQQQLQRVMGRESIWPAPPLPRLLSPSLALALSYPLPAHLALSLALRLLSCARPLRAAAAAAAAVAAGDWPHRRSCGKSNGTAAAAVSGFKRRQSGARARREKGKARQEGNE